jgi:hypothetical protein
MIPTNCVKHLLSEPNIRAGEPHDVWGFFHEMGHNHQRADWTFDGTTEVTVNFFTLYNMLKICGRTTRQTKMGNPALLRNVERWNAAGRPADAWFADPFLALDLFARLADKYGWEAFEKLFAEYASLPPEERPKADIEKRKGVKLPHQFYVRYDRPERNPWLKEGLAKGIFTGTDDPDYKRLLGEIEKARPMLDLRNDVDIREVIGAFE